MIVVAVKKKGVRDSDINAALLRSLATQRSYYFATSSTKGFSGLTGLVSKVKSTTCSGVNAWLP